MEEIELSDKQIEMLNNLKHEKDIATMRFGDLINFILSSKDIDVLNVTNTRIEGNKFLITLKKSE